MPTTDDDTTLPDEYERADGSAADGDAPGVDPPPGVDPRRRRALLRLFTVVTAVVLLVDQLTKVWAVAALEPGVRRPLVGELFGLQLIRNDGAALSIASGMTWVLSLVATAVVVVIVRVSRRLGSRGWAVALGLLLGGALGNLVDRMVREPGPLHGHVIDFLAYWRLFIGNVADIAIVVAAVLVVWLTARGIHVDGTRDDRHHDEDPAEPDDATDGAR
ncbi:signal peptidase II [Cellulomonas xiejunii]|uniref:Lipoprotein signal peptidase n=1 Tax=Cellulomonas xiejunii TaxID=2968083 RepID=A0ABY5KS76_9CELL|nr:signal peptidase II [Cellulomonas xiejunii]MCC2322064.1 signal peptidase II [Cellulomonas xiejunii]UUI73352.1 signal peptidase II [Cellulomonas xiejunii]